MGKNSDLRNIQNAVSILEILPIRMKVIQFDTSKNKVAIAAGSFD